MWVEVEGGRLYVESAGGGSPLLMVHGWPLDHRIFEPQVRDLAKIHQLITFDRRGFGVSQAAPDLGLEVDDIRRIIDALSLESVHLLGMSQGARIALRVAVSLPHVVRSLLLQGPAIDGFVVNEADGERIPLDEYARLARAGRMDEVRRRWLSHPMMALPGASDRTHRLLDEIMKAYKGTDLIGNPAGKTPFEVDVLAVVRDLRAPCLLLTGAHETAARRAHARKLLELIPDCREVVMAKSGHLSNFSEPKTYNRQVAGFCALVDAQEAGSGAGALD